MVSTKKYLSAGKSRFSILQKVRNFKWNGFWQQQELKLVNFGFSLFLAWNFVFFFSSAITKFYSSPATATSALGLSSGLSNVAGYLAIIVLSKYLCPLYRRPKAGLTLSGLAGAGTLIAFAAPLFAPEFSLPSSILGGMLTGIGTAWAVASWGEFLSTLTPYQITICVLGSFFLGATLYFPIVALPPLAAAIVSALLIPICWRLSWVSIDEANALPVLTKKSGATFRKQTWRIVLTFFVFSTSFWVFVEASSRLVSLSATDTFRLAVLLSAGFIALFCIASIVLNHLTSLDTIYRIALPLTAIGLIFIFIFDPASTDLGFALAMSAITCLDAFLTITLCATSHETGYPPAKALSIGHCFEGLCVPLGVLIGNVALPGIEAGELAIVLIVVCILILTISLVFGYNQTSKKSAGDFDGNHFDAPIASAEKFAQQCNTAISRFGLSERESEILLLITRGRSVPYIAQRLHIANSTTKTHIHSMYTKMDVADRQGMIDLIESLEIDEF